MKKRILNIFTFIGLTVVLFIVLPYVFNFFYFGGAFMRPPNKEQIERSFERNKALFITIASYMENTNNDTISIDEFNSDQIIEDWKTSMAIHTLLWRKYYNCITKHYSTISFQKWSGIHDTNRGIAYTKDGKKPSIEFLTKSEPLSESGWYYFEADYEEWRIQTNGIPHYILGVWNIQSAQNRNTKENYPLQNLYGTGVEQGGILTFNTDFTFSRHIGITTDEAYDYEGTYSLSYDDKIILKYNNGTVSTVKYLPSSQEIVYYTWDKDQIPIDEYYIKYQ